MITDLMLANENLLKTQGYDWVKELYDFLVKAREEKKLIYQRHYGLVFTPDGLVNCFLKNQFRWGKINWELIDKDLNTVIDYPDPQ